MGNAGSLTSTVVAERPGNGVAWSILRDNDSNTENRGDISITTVVTTATLVRT